MTKHKRFTYQQIYDRLITMLIDQNCYINSINPEKNEKKWLKEKERYWKISALFDQLNKEKELRCKPPEMVRYEYRNKVPPNRNPPKKEF